MSNPKIVNVEKKNSGQWWASYDDNKQRRVSDDVAKTWLKSARPVVERVKARESLLERRRRKQRARANTKPTSMLERRRLRRAQRRLQKSLSQFVVSSNDDNTGKL